MIGIDLFSGAGGMSLGALQSGIDVQYAVEFDQFAAKTFIRNHPYVKMFIQDIRTINASMFSDLDRNHLLIVFGGPPCQGFSTSNQKNRNIENEKNWLFIEYLRIVKELKPDWIIFENVKGIIETEKGIFLDFIIDGFQSLGYHTSHFILNSSDYGVPQNRNRLFVIASLHNKKISSPVKISNNKITVAEAIRDLPKVYNGNKECILDYFSEPVSSYAKLMRGNSKQCHNNLVTKNSDYVIKRYTHIPQGGNWESIPQDLMTNYKDSNRCHTGIYRRLKEDEPSVVIGNFRKNMLIHPWENRGLSVREAARLQSFPDSFIFEGSIGYQQQQVGNAVPPLLAKAVFDYILLNS